jgi:hypothetical protein
MVARKKEVRDTNARAKVVQRHNKRELEKVIHETIKQAESLRPSSSGGSKKDRIAGIQEARTAELNLERKLRALTSSQRNKIVQAPEIIPFNPGQKADDSDNEGAYPDLNDVLFEDDE